MAQINYWKLAIWKGVTGPLMAAVAAIPTVVLNWESMTPSGKFVACIGLVLTWYKAFDMFLDNTMSRLAQGKPPVQLPGMNGSEIHQESTTVTDIKTPPTQTPMSFLKRFFQRPLRTISTAIILALVTGSGCSSLQPGADPVVVRAEQTTEIALDTFDIFLKLEREHESALLKVNPGIHKFADFLRDNSEEWFATVRRLTATYKRNRTPEAKANLATIVALLGQSLAEAQTYIGKATLKPESP